MKRITKILTSLLAVFIISSLIHASISFRMAGPVVTIRLVLGLISFCSGGLWLLLSLLAIPRALLGLYKNRTGPRTELRWAMAALAMALSPIILIGAIMLIGPSCCVTSMPGKSYTGALPALTPEQQQLRARLSDHVTALATGIGPRSAAYNYQQSCQAADYIAAAFSNMQFKVSREPFFPANNVRKGQACENIAVEIPGTSRPAEIVVIGAHYDTAGGTPGANDNASGVAAVLELARTFAHTPCARTLRFVAFANEEPPFFWTKDMGSMVCAANCRARNENVVAMLSLETIGCYLNEPGSQHYPTKILEWFFPTTGNFISFVGDTASGGLVQDAIASFRKNAQIPSEGAAMPSVISGVGWSDHWSFWQHGYPAIEITDTAPFRYSWYHTHNDTPDKINYEPYTYVVSQLATVIKDLAK